MIQNFGGVSNPAAFAGHIAVVVEDVRRREKLRHNGVRQVDQEDSRLGEVEQVAGDVTTKGHKL